MKNVDRVMEVIYGCILVCIYPYVLKSIMILGMHLVSIDTAIIISVVLISFIIFTVICLKFNLYDNRAGKDIVTSIIGVLIGFILGIVFSYLISVSGAIKGFYKYCITVSIPFTYAGIKSVGYSIRFLVLSEATYIFGIFIIKYIRKITRKLKR